MLGMKRSISLLLCLLMCLSLFPASAFAEELSDAEQMEEPVIVVEAEQDPAKANPFEYAKMARKYIREKTGL